LTLTAHQQLDTGLTIKQKARAAMTWLNGLTAVSNGCNSSGGRYGSMQQLQQGLNS
jgi:hypothetical protein